MTFNVLSKSLRPSKRQTPAAARRRPAPLAFVALLLVFGLAAADAAAQGGTGNVIHIYSEGFDGVTAPNLPAGWTAATTGGGVPFTTVAGSTQTDPNVARVTMPAAEGTSALLSPPILINQPGAVITIRHRFNTEIGWDGGRVDVIPDPLLWPPGSYFPTPFLANGYNSKFSARDNPANMPVPDAHLAWTGNSDGYVETKIALPDYISYNYSIRIQFTAAHDGTFAEDGEWLIDSLSVTGEFTATNAGPITIPSSGAASPYPSEIAVSGLIGAVTQVVVRLHNFSHTSPDDVDVLLVAPNGRKLILMSDAGGTHSLTNVTLSFADFAPGYLPDEGQIAEGAYKPTDHGGGGDSFPSPAPSGGTLGTTLQSFFGGAANGTYKLFVVDDNGNNAGSVGGWSIAFRTSSNVCHLSFSPVVAYPAAGGSGTMQVNTQAGCSWSLTYYSPDVIDVGGLDIEGVGSGSFNYTVKPNPSTAPRTGSFNFRSATQITGTHIQQQGQPLP